MAFANDDMAAKGLPVTVESLHDTPECVGGWLRCEGGVSRRCCSLLPCALKRPYLTAVMADGVSAALSKARKECFSDEDRYWHGSNASFEGPLNPRNEAAALSRLLVSREGE